MFRFISIFTCFLSLGYAAAASFRVGRIDGVDRSPVTCHTSSSGAVECIAGFRFPETTRFWVDVPPTYAVAVAVQSVKVGACNTRNNLYVMRKPNVDFSVNSLDAFKNANAVELLASAFDDNTPKAVLGAGCSHSETVRYHIGVHQASNGVFGACSTGVVTLFVSDGSATCGYRLPDRQCYAGSLACYDVAQYGGTVRTDVPGIDKTVCCPRATSGSNVLTASQCTCSGKDHGSAPTSAPAMPPLDGCVVSDKGLKVTSAEKGVLLYCEVEGGKNRLVAPRFQSTLGIRIPAGIRSTNGKKFQVYVWRESDKIKYMQGEKASCGYTGCGDEHTVWSRYVAVDRPGPVYVFVRCDDGCELDLSLSLMAEYDRLEAVEAGACRFKSQCTDFCGFPSTAPTFGAYGSCCADCTETKNVSVDGSKCSNDCAPLGPVETQTSSRSAATPTLSPSMMAGACQTPEYCANKCPGFDASSLNGYGTCCYDCTSALNSGSFSIRNGVCSNSCRAARLPTPHPTPYPTPYTVPLAPTSSVAECTDCKCHSNKCFVKCPQGARVNTCKSLDGQVLYHSCECQSLNASRADRFATMAPTTVVAAMIVGTFQ